MRVYHQKAQVQGTRLIHTHRKCPWKKLTVVMAMAVEDALKWVKRDTSTLTLKRSHAVRHSETVNTINMIRTYQDQYFGTTVNNCQYQYQFFNAYQYQNFQYQYSQYLNSINTNAASTNTESLSIPDQHPILKTNTQHHYWRWYMSTLVLMKLSRIFDET